MNRKLTEDDVRLASEACPGNHATEECRCLQVEHEGHIDYVVDHKLVHREADGTLVDHGEFRILDDDFLAFYEGVESLVQEQPIKPI
jgi:hypothetical protein